MPQVMKANATKTCITERLVKLFDHASRLSWVAITIREYKTRLVSQRT
jgi:hypothetical protein